MDLYLGLFWQDPRFELGLNQSLTLGGRFTDNFWLPDTFFVNSVQTNVHETILPNKKVWINFNGGYMMLSARYIVLEGSFIYLVTIPIFGASKNKFYTPYMSHHLIPG